MLLWSSYEKRSFKILKHKEDKIDPRLFVENPDMGGYNLLLKLYLLPTPHL
jgi:hypothetical protein